MKTLICVVPRLTLAQDTGGTGISHTNQFHSLHYLHVGKKKITAFLKYTAEYTSYQQHSSRALGDAENVFQMEGVKRPAEFFKFHFKICLSGKGILRLTRMSAMHKS